MRSLFFNIGFWWVSFWYVVLAAVLALIPGHKGVRWAVKRYSTRMVQLMKLCGIKPEARGRERLPAAPFIVAPKHSSYGDGFLMYVQFDVGGPAVPALVRSKPVRVRQPARFEKPSPGISKAGT